MHPLALAPALCLLLSPVSAQQLLAPGSAPQVLSSPIERVVHVVHDVATETTRVVRISTPGELALGTPPCFDSSELTGGLGLALSAVANPGEDLLSWGTKRCSGASLLRGFTLAYKSSAQSVDRGGPGAAFSIALYSGTTGFGQPGNEIFRRTFTGLPTGLSDAILLTLDFSTDPLPLADGAFGWSYLQMDGFTGPVLVAAPKPILGTRDALDIYAPGPARASNYRGTFNYGGCQTPGTFTPCASTWMQLDEILPSELALSAELNGSGVNPQILHELLPARLGHVFAAAVDFPTPGSQPVVATLLIVSNALGTAQTTRFGELLVDLDQQRLPPILGRGSYSFPIPADRALVGTRVYLQAAVLPSFVPRLTLTNALRVRIGY